jgi:hypothetical protein
MLVLTTNSLFIYKQNITPTISLIYSNSANYFTSYSQTAAMLVTSSSLNTIVGFGNGDVIYFYVYGNNANSVLNSSKLLYSHSSKVIKIVAIDKNTFLSQD